MEIMADDMHGIRTILDSKTDPARRWESKQKIVVKAFLDAVGELAAAGYDGFVDTLPDGRAILGVITPDGRRPSLLIGPAADSRSKLDIEYSTTFATPEIPPGFMVG